MSSLTAINRDVSLVPMCKEEAIYLISMAIVTILTKKVEKKYSYYR